MAIIALRLFFVPWDNFFDLPALFSSLRLRADLRPRCWFPYVSLRCQDLPPSPPSPPRSSRYSREPPCWLLQLKVVRLLFPPPVRGSQRPRVHLFLQLRPLKTCSLLLRKMVSICSLYRMGFNRLIILERLSLKIKMSISNSVPIY